MPGAKKPLEAHFSGDKNGKVELHSQKEVEELVKQSLKNEKFEVLSGKNGEKRRKKTTASILQQSTLQQEAFKTFEDALHKKTMRLAQENCYEGVKLKGKGSIGSYYLLKKRYRARISEEADANCRRSIWDS